MMDCPDGMLTREKVLEMLLYILPRSATKIFLFEIFSKYFLYRENGQIVADLIFTAFDKVMENTAWSHKNLCFLIVRIRMVGSTSTNSSSPRTVQPLAALRINCTGSSRCTTRTNPRPSSWGRWSSSSGRSISTRVWRKRPRWTGPWQSSPRSTSTMTVM